MNTDLPAIAVETGEDEAFLIGTREELRTLGETLVKVAKLSGEQMSFHGIPALQIPESLTDPMAEIVLDGIVIVENKKARLDLTNIIRVNGGGSPIDWEAVESESERRQQGEALNP